MPFNVPEHGMPQREFAELRGERHVLRMREELLSKEDHAPFQQGRANLRDLMSVERLRQIDATDFSTDKCRQRRNLDRLGIACNGCVHCVSPEGESPA